MGGDDHGTSATEEQPYSSWWLGLVGKADGESLLFGALASTKTRVWTAFTDQKAWVVWGHRGDRITLAAGEELRLDPVWIHSGEDAFDLHVQYAKTAASYHNIPERQDRPPIGWATWYTFYSHIDEEIVRGNLDVAIELADNPDLEPMTLFQIDDGWQKHWGDWTATRPFLPGWNWQVIFVGRIRCGLWMAPLCLYLGTHIAEHDDWWVLDENTNPSPMEISVRGTMPSSMSPIRKRVPGCVISRTTTTAGMDYLKLDFFYAGAQRGKDTSM